MTPTPETAPRLPWWLSAPLALLGSAFFAYFFVRSLQGDHLPWEPPAAAVVYGAVYGVLALVFLGGAAVAIRGKLRGDQ